MGVMKAMKAQPKKVMKAMKKQPSTTPAKGKAKAKARPLKKGQLEKLGTMSLKDKIKKISEDHSDEVEAALVLKESMTPEEKTRTWNRHNKQINKPGNEDALAKFQSANRKEKGLLTALWLMRQDAPKFCTVAKEATMETTLEKEEKWMSEKEAYDKWGETDLNKHIETGRVIWTENCGVFEYQDTQAYTKRHKGSKRNSWQVAQEYEQAEDELQGWDEMMETDLQQLVNELIPGKGRGKGSTPGRGKGSRKGKGKGRRSKEKEMEEEEDEEEDDIGKALGKLKKTRDLLVHTSANYEEALEKVKKMNYLGKQALKEKEATFKALNDSMQKVKNTLVKGDKNKIEKVKALLVDSVKAVNEAREEAKELVQITLKTHSKAASSKK